MIRATAAPYSYGDLTTVEALTFYGPATLALAEIHMRRGLS